MKKILFTITAIIAVISLSSCKGDTGPAGPPGLDGLDGVTSYWVPTEFVVAPGEWERMGDPDDPNSYFFVDKPLQALNDDIFYDGIVVGYMAVDFDNDNNPTIKQVLPYSVPLVEGSRQYTRTYDFDYWIGGVRFYLNYSDFKTSIKPADTQKFYIILAY